MKRILLTTIILFTFFPESIFSQNTWTQKANFGGTSRRGSVGFSIGSKGYCGTGNDGINGVRNDFWEYNPANNTWTQKANFGGAARMDAVGFSIGVKGYMGTGGNLTDFWEYDPSNNSWTQKAPYGGPASSGAVGFSIGSKGYIGTGFSGNSFFTDFWEYNPLTDTWLQKTSFPGLARAYATGFGIGNKGYLGHGAASFINNYVDFWEYDPSTNSWIQKANISNSATLGSAGFCIGTKGYVGGGASFTNRYNDFWEYNPVTDSWLQRIHYPGTPLGFVASFSIGNKGYMGIGSTLPGSTNQFYEYTPIPSLITETIPGSPFCAGNALQVNYTTTTTYIIGNTFAAQLSDAFGNFSNAVTIGSVTATNSGTIGCVIPQNTPAGFGYRIRVISSLPVDIGTENGVNLIICSVTWPISFAPVCINDPSFALSGGSPSGGTYAGPGVTDGIFNPSQLPPGTYTLSYSVLNTTTGCFCSTTNTITVRALPIVTWPVTFAPICGNSSAFLLNGGLPFGGTYSGPGVDAFGNFNPTQVPFGTVTLLYTYTDAFGCTNTTPNTINIINCIDCGTCYSPDTNLIVNGNFNNGNTGFSSGLPNNCICDVGSYCVTTDAYLKCINFFHINDHTSGTGNFMVVDGSTTSNVIVWQQSVSVAGSTNYTFSFWVHPQVSFIASNPILNIIIDNVSQGSINTALLPKHWNNIVFSWTSNSPANITVTIKQTNSSDPGMDYGLDDLSFNACIPVAVADGGPDRVICSGDTVHLSNSNNLLTNNWYEINTGNPANYPFIGTGDIIVSPTVNTCYLLVACEENCCDTDSVCITVNPVEIATWSVSYSDVCNNGSPYQLSGALPAGGVYSGAAVNGSGQFDPALAQFGSNIITYTYTNTFGCVSSVNNTVNMIYCISCSSCFSPGPELVVNGNFNGGNTGFTSTFGYSCTCQEATYCVTTNSFLKCNHNTWFSIMDHTSANGNYMVVDGGSFPNEDVWSENINVVQGQTYTFSFWVHPSVSNVFYMFAVYPDLDVRMNGTTILSTTGGAPLQWTHHLATWVANVSGIIPITLRQTNAGLTGNDYGLDDISFKACEPILQVDWPISFAGICNNSQPFQLTGGMPSGGTYSGPGVSDNYFDPSSVLPGIHILTYTYTDNNGCTNYVTNTITVLPLPTVTWSLSFAPICGNSSSFLLNGGLPSGGTYSGPGVDAFGNFDPTLVPFGTVAFLYTYTDGFGCSNTASNTINVINCIDCEICTTPGPNLIFNENFSLGDTGFASTLLDSCVCKFGSYCVTTDAKLKCNNFDHVYDHTSGTGNFLAIDGSQTSNQIIWQQNLSVVNDVSYIFSFWLHPEISDGFFKADLKININNLTQFSFTMQGMAAQWNKINVSWTSNITGSIPVIILQSNSGDYGYDYGIDDLSFNACTPDVVADGGPDRVICSGDTVHLSNSNNLHTNDWYEINTGNPANYPFLGTGDIVVSPTVNTCYLLVACEENCCDTDSVCINVNPLPVVTWPVSFAPICAGQQPFQLTGGMPSGGTYSGPGVNGSGIFNPANAPFGTIVLTYSYTDPSGCSNSATNTITLNDTPSVFLPLPFSVCNTNGAFSLFSNPSGGLFSGNITGVGTFDPSTATLGDNLIIYNYTDPVTGCSNSATTIITVLNCGCCGLGFEPGAEKIYNGDFESGNVGFSIDPSVIINCNACQARSFCVTTSAKLKCSFFQDVKDHTSGQGKYLVLDKLFSPPNQTNIIWEQNVNVVSGKKYAFSYWLYINLINIVKYSGPDLEVIINNQSILIVDLPKAGNGVIPLKWTKYCLQWIADTTGIVNLKIKQAGSNGKEMIYGIDDISFKECKPIGCNAIAGPDIESCPGENVLLTNLAGASCDWYQLSSPGNNVFLGFGDLIVSPVANTCYMLVCCTPTCCDTDTICIKIQIPEVTWPVSFSPVCSDIAPVALTGGMPAGGIYSGPGVDAFGNFNPANVPFGQTIISYTYINSEGCPATATNTIEVIQCVPCEPCFSPGTNQAINGDFESGNTGFTSDLTMSCTCGLGTYCVSDSASNKCNTFNNVHDHTSGTGNYLIIEGSQSQNNLSVWKENVSVISGRTYFFTFWIHPALSNGTGRPDIDIIINNQSQLSITTQFSPAQWVNNSFTWVANLTGTIPIALKQTNGGSSGYVYGLDDILFTGCVPTCAVNLHLKLFIEGFYKGGNTMIATVDPINYPTLCDTITVELHNELFPYGLVHSVINTIDVNGNGQFVFPGDVLTNSYYIAIRHRNSIETWSKNPILFDAPVKSFDFTRQ